MSDTPLLTATSLEDRRAARRRGRAFEEQAFGLVETHVSQLDTHRRSVLLFYLLFGLVVGFVLGIAGANGVLANTIDQSTSAWAEPAQQTRLNVQMPTGLAEDWPGASIQGPAGQCLYRHPRASNLPPEPAAQL